MTQEEKAKRYDDLLVKLQKAKEDNEVCDERYCCVIDDIVPELKESEDRIRKALIKFHKSTIDIDGIKGEDILAWLEKQGEQEHVIAPKFDIGDIIRNKITNEVFTITDRCISLEYYHDINHLHEVKFSEQDNWELVKHKLAWSEEDENIRQWIISDIDKLLALKKKSFIIYNKEINWLKSLRTQKHWKPTGAQLASLEIACDRNDRVGFDLTQLLKELKKVREE